VLTAVRRVPAPPDLPAQLWPAIRMPAAEALRLGGVGPIEPALRARLGINWNWFDEARFRALGIACRSLGPALPERLKITGPAQLDSGASGLRLIGG